MIKRCVVCGKEFECMQRNYKLCSDECRVIRKGQYRKKYKNNGKILKYRQKESRKRRNNPKDIFCKICRKPVPHVSTLDAWFVSIYTKNV